MSNKAKHRLLYAIGLVLCVLPVLFCILSEFPLWVRSGIDTIFSGFVLSGISLTLVVVACTPLIRVVGRKIKTPAVWMMWGIAALIFYSVKNVIDSLVLISTFGFIGNALGAFFFALAGKYADKEREDEHREH